MKKRILFLLGLLGMLSLCGCKLQKENEVILNTTENGEISSSGEQQENTEEMLTAKVLLVDYLQEDIEKYNLEEYLLETILEMTYEEALPYRYSENICIYNTNTWAFSVRSSKAGFNFHNSEYKKSTCYVNIERNLWNGKSVEGISDWQWRGLCEEEEIDACTKEEAIAFCAPYAEALGITEPDVQVDTYALTLDILQASGIGAPDEEFEYVCINDLKRMAEKENWTEQRLMEEYDKINYIPSIENSPQWEKKHEAIILLYRRTLNGLWVDDSEQVAMMIYVPYYGEIVSASGNLPMLEKEVIREAELISKEKAMSIAMNEKGNIKIQDIELVYSLEKEDEFSSLTELIAYPVWRINYKIGERQDSIWIDAIDGFVRRVN